MGTPINRELLNCFPVLTEALLKNLVKAADQAGIKRIAIVGGIIRDQLINKSLNQSPKKFFDIDLIIEENPKKLAEWAKRNSLGWLEKARKFPDIADTAIEQVSKLEEYQNANEERHNQLMNKIYEQGKLNRALLIGFIILILFLIID